MQPAKTGLILSVRVAACSVIILAAAIRLHCIVIKNPSRRRRHCLFFCQYPCKGSPSPLHFSRKGGKINRTHPRIHGDTKFSLQLQKTTPNSHTKEHPKKCTPIESFSLHFNHNHNPLGSTGPGRCPSSRFTHHKSALYTRHQVPRGAPPERPHGKNINFLPAETKHTHDTHGKKCKSPRRLTTDDPTSASAKYLFPCL